MSEFYSLRRNAITDMSAFFGFLIGFLGSSPIAWPYLQVGFQTQEIVRGFTWFIVITFGSGVALGVVGLGVGRVLGSLWEGGHRVVRRAKGREFADASGPPRDAAFPLDVVRAGARGTPVESGDGAIRLSGGVEAQELADLARRSGLPAPDVDRLRAAMSRTVNIGAWDSRQLVGAVRILSDGYQWTVVTDILVDPAYRRRGIGTALMRQAAERGAGGGLSVAQVPPGTEGFFRRLEAIPAYEGFVRGSKSRLQ